MEEERKPAFVLIDRMRQLCGDERVALCGFLQGLAAIEEQGLHLQLGWPNMFELCRVEFGLSEGCIYRRLQVARKLKHYPELLEALKANQINLTLASMLCPYLGKHSFATLISCVAGQTKRVAQKALRDLEDIDLVALPASRVQYVGKEHYSYRLKVPAQLHHQWERVRELLSHQIPDGDIQTILVHLTESFLKKNDPQLKAGVSADLWLHYASPNRYIPKGLKVFLMDQAEHQCQYRAPDGRRCTQKRYLDIDHIIPIAAGGLTSLQNLQVLCHAHNLLKSDHLPPATTNHNQSATPARDGRRMISPRSPLNVQWQKAKGS